MTPRERVSAALAGAAPDRVPVALGFSKAAVDDMIPVGDGAGGEAVDVRFVSLSPLRALEELRRTGLPFKPDTRLGTAAQAYTYAQWTYRPQRLRGTNPLAKARSIDDIRAFRFPAYRTSSRSVGQVARTVSGLHARGLAVGGNLPHLGGELFESAWRLRGLRNFLLDMQERPSWANELLERLTAFAVRNAKALAGTGIDVLALGDDVGMPESMMIGPGMWREFFKPRFLRIIGAARSVSPGLPVLFHSDGWFEPILEDLVEIGVNAIHPVQPEHMDGVRIRRRFGSRLAFWGTVGSQSAFSRGKPAEIRREVKRRVDSLGREGLILSPAYDIDTKEIPRRNIEAFLSAAREFG